MENNSNQGRICERSCYGHTSPLLYTFLSGRQRVPGKDDNKDLHGCDTNWEKRAGNIWGTCRRPNSFIKKLKAMSIAGPKHRSRTLSPTQTHSSDPLLCDKGVTPTACRLPTV
eukprot:9469524-Pyramimonas_sp.AAC.1